MLINVGLLFPHLLSISHGLSLAVHLDCNVWIESSVEQGAPLCFVCAQCSPSLWLLLQSASAVSYKLINILMTGSVWWSHDWGITREQWGTHGAVRTILSNCCSCYKNTQKWCQHCSTSTDTCSHKTAVLKIPTMLRSQLALSGSK